MSRDWGIANCAIGALAVLCGVTVLFRGDAPPQVAATPPRKVVIAPAPIELPPSEPSSAVPTLTEAAKANVDKRVGALASELARMWTFNPQELVNVIDEASRQAPVSPSETLLLAI